MRASLFGPESESEEEWEVFGRKRKQEELRHCGAAALESEAERLKSSEGEKGAAEMAPVCV